MKVAVRFLKDNETLYRHVAEIVEEFDLMNAHREAVDEFRKKFPDESLFQGNLVIGYEKA